MRRKHIKSAPQGAFGVKRARPIAYATTSEILKSDPGVESIPDRIPGLSLPELTGDLQDIREAVSWFPASGYMTCLLKELLREMINTGGSEMLSDLGISENSDLSFLNDMSAAGIVEILDEALISVPEEFLAKRIDRNLIDLRQTALIRTRQKEGSSSMIDYETGYDSGCTGKATYPDKLAAEFVLEDDPTPSPNAHVYRCKKCVGFHISKRFINKYV